MARLDQPGQQRVCVRRERNWSVCIVIGVTFVAERKKAGRQAGDEAAAAMEPWEQHHAVINMPRFAYNPASILENNVGFLITCTFRREKSATKEVLALLKEYMTLGGDGTSGNPSSDPVYNGTGTGQSDKQPAEEREAFPETGLVASSDDIPAIPRPTEQPSLSFKKSDMQNVEDSTGREAGSVANLAKDTGRCNEGEEGACAHLDPLNPSDDHDFRLKAGCHELILVKLATMGVIYISTSGKSPSTVLSVVSRIVKDVQAGTRAAPQWCHRMVPVQATCSMKREELQAVVSQLVKDHLRDHSPSNEQPINYAVAFNRRGAGVTGSCLSDSPQATILSRDECIKVVTSAVEQVTTTIRVDLTTPQMVVMVELIPVAGVQSSLICAVSVLPGDLILSKPKLTIKPLAPLNPKSKKRKTFLM